MFCPKCGLQHAVETKFCRSCGADLNNVLAVVEGKPTLDRAKAEKHIELFSSGIRGVMIGVGFLLVSGAAFAISSRLAVMFLFFLAFASYFLGTGISRLIHARGLKALNAPDSDRPAQLINAGQADYIKPSRSIYDTDELMGRPLSVTENTTTHLEMDPDGETFALPKT